MRGCALRKVVRNLAHKKLGNQGVEPQHLPSQVPRLNTSCNTSTFTLTPSNL